MNFLQSLEISASGLYAQRKRMDIIASNLANIETTRTPEGGPYRRKMIVMRARPVTDFDRILDLQARGVSVDGVVDDPGPFKKVFNPNHPDADRDGYLLKPNIDLLVEMTNLLIARRVFEANVGVLKVTKQMAIKALEIGR
ncbi:MAG: flagellar basal body rod protein FlgC [Deltaproteobacteria bacterium]|nr:flagellar basal body rod protein FlgC [Deltaproteobacteria bacterium]